LRSCLNAGHGEMPALLSCQFSRKKRTTKQSRTYWNMHYHLLCRSKWCGNFVKASKRAISPIEFFLTQKCPAFCVPVS
jgi:hypothetical protein